jgi:hypothetical protein
MHVAGIAVGRANDGVGVAGVAPGCRVMPLRALGVQGGTVTDVADAIRYAAGLVGTDHGGPLAAPLRVVNLSLGTPVDAAELRTAVEDAAAAGVLLVVSSGNDGSAVQYPAAYDDVLAVAAVDGRLVWAPYSSWGPQVDLAAPGGNGPRDVAADGFDDEVLSCLLDETVVPTTPSWGYEAGTSRAPPRSSSRSTRRSPSPSAARRSSRPAATWTRRGATSARARACSRSSRPSGRSSPTSGRRGPTRRASSSRLGRSASRPPSPSAS